MATPQRAFYTLLLCTLTAAAAAAQSGSSGLVSRDLVGLRSVDDAQISRDGGRIAYTVSTRAQSGSSTRIWLYDVSTRQSRVLLESRGNASEPRWSPDGKWLAFRGAADGRSGLMIVAASGDPATVKFVAPVQGTNAPMPSTGERMSWSPDSRRIAFVSASPGPETEAASGDPVVITRYLYKPNAAEGSTRFNDNRRLHIQVADLEAGTVRQLTSGDYNEHSIDWSPRGDEILFVSNREPDPDRVFNYDLFALRLSDGSVRRLTSTKAVEYRPRWSPDGRTIAYLGTKRDLTSSETTMEDTHVWLMDADGGNRRELGADVDNRQGAPQWSRTGESVYFTVQSRGNTQLHRLPARGGVAEPLITEPGRVGSWSVGAGEVIAYTFTSPGDLAQLFWWKPTQRAQLTNLNQEVFASKSLASVESFVFRSFDGMEVQAFLTRPLRLSTTNRHPLITVIHGGPHGQQGVAFDFQSQVYANQGYAVLMVNFRGSTGYGQRFADAIFGDQNGGEAKDVLYGVDAALRRNAWLHPDRLGVQGTSYGGQLSNWLVTQTNRFAAAIPIAGISNLITQNYLSYYHDYLAVEFGAFPHQGKLMDVLWERSPLRYVAQVRTPVLLVHGENDNDVPIAEAEQFYIALKDVGVETVMVRYPREGHGIRQIGHVIDLIDRSIAWYEKHFARKRPRTPTNLN